MGVESDRLVFDYLSRVGDLAQTALPAADRMRLVAQLRRDIDQQRGEGDTPASVERLLGRIGSPDEVVEAAASSAPAPRRAEAPPPAEPPPGSYGPYTRPRRAARGAAEGRDGGDRTESGDGTAGMGGAAGAKPDFRKRPGRDGAARADRATPPGFRFSTPEDGAARDWWQEAAGSGPLAGEELTGLPGMTGSISIPFDDEDLGSGRAAAERAAAKAAEAEAAEAAAEEEPEAAPAARRRPLGGLLRRRRRGDGGGGAGARRWGGPMLLLGAALLVAGAVAGSWVLLGAGWLAGYFSRAYSRTQAKIAVFGVPGTAAAGLLLWVWGRGQGKWGDPIAHGRTGQAVLDGLPVTVRVAAAGSAAYLLWRARRSV